MKRKIISLCVASVLAVANVSVFAEHTDTTDNPFVDTYGKWYESSVAYVYSAGIINGVSSSEFAPEKNVSRAELAAMLCRIVSKETDNSEDVTEIGSEWYASAQKWAEDNNIMDGIVTDNNFDAQKALKREEIMVMIYNTYKISHQLDASLDTALDRFKDTQDISEYAKPAVSWTVDNKIIQGNDEQKLNPQDNVTRAETAAIIERFLTNCDFTDKTETANPVIEYTTLEDAQNAAKLNMPLIQDEKLNITGYYTIDESDNLNVILGAKGTYNGKNIDIRVGGGDRSISGIYGGEPLEGGNKELSVVYEKYQDTVYAQWAVTKPEKIYCYSAAIEGGTPDELNAIVDAIGAEILTDAETENPVVEYGTLEEAQNACGLALPEIKNFKAQGFYTMSEQEKNEAVLGVSGTYNGKILEIRVGNGDRDISGISDKEKIDIDLDGMNVECGQSDNVLCVNWARTIDKEIYCYSVVLENGTKEEIKEIVNTIGADKLVQD